MHIKLLTTLLASASLVRTYKLPEFPASESKAPYRLYSTFAVPAANISIDFNVRGFTGAPYRVNLTTSDLAKITPLHSRPITEIAALQERDICAFGRGCYQYAADNGVTAAIFIANTFVSTCQVIYSAALAYWTDNNYANLNAVLQNAIVGFAINIASTPLGNVLWNAESAQTEGPDGCNVDTDKARTANQYSSALYDFCMAIQSAQSVDSAPREIVFGQMTDDEVADRSVGVVKQFIAAQAGNFGPVCQAFGIEWKRALMAAGRLIGDLD